MHITPHGLRRARTRDYANTIAHILADFPIPDGAHAAVLYTAMILCSSSQDDTVTLTGSEAAVDRKLAKFINKNSKRIDACLEWARKNADAEHREMAADAIHEKMEALHASGAQGR